MPKRLRFPGFCCLGAHLVLQENACDGTAKLAEDFATQTTSANADGVSCSLLTVVFGGLGFFGGAGCMCFFFLVFLLPRSSWR